MIRRLLLALLTVPALYGCNRCDANKAQNKMLALGRIESRLVAKGGESGGAVAGRVALDSAPIYEMITAGNYDEACKAADALAAKLGANLDNEMSDMLTMEQLAKDGGKGSGSCSIADAAKKQMEIVELLQAEVAAGKRDSEVMREFSEDSAPYGEMLTRNPSEACALLEKLRKKYGLK